MPNLAVLFERSLGSTSSAKHAQKPKQWRMSDAVSPVRGRKNSKQLIFQTADSSVFIPERFRKLLWSSCSNYFTRLCSHARYEQAMEPPHAQARHRWGETKGETAELFKSVRVQPYLVGSAGGVESICSANKQRVFVLLQQHLDEIVTLVLRKSKRRENKEMCIFWKGHFHCEKADLCCVSFSDSLSTRRPETE